MRKPCLWTVGATVLTLGITGIVNGTIIPAEHVRHEHPPQPEIRSQIFEPTVTQVATRQYDVDSGTGFIITR